MVVKALYVGVDCLCFWCEHSEHWLYLFLNKFQIKWLFYRQKKGLRKVVQKGVFFLSISIFTRMGNKLEQLLTTSNQLRYKRMGRKLSAFFNVTKNDTRYAKNNRSKGKYLPIFITLTYENGDSWDSKDISKLIKRYKKHFTSGGKKALMPISDFRYVWVAELQKRGVIHYHIVMWLPRFMKLSGLKPDDLGWWNHGFTNVVAVKKSVFAYLSKYMSKGSVKGFDEDGNEVWHTFPKGARIYGSGGLSALQRVKIAYTLLPRWVQSIFIDDESKIKRVKGGFKQGKTELMSPYLIVEGGDWRDIIYDKKFSVINDKENEIEWDNKISSNHVDTHYFSILKIITSSSSEWNNYLVAGM